MSAAVEPVRGVARFNRESGVVWVDWPGQADGQLISPHALTKLDAYAALGEAGLVRWDNWLPSYGPVVECHVTTPIETEGA